MTNRWIMQLIETANEPDMKMPWARTTSRAAWATACRKRALTLGGRNA